MLDVVAASRSDTGLKRGLAFALGVTALVAVLTTVGTLACRNFLPDGAAILSEDGPVETLSAVIWGLSAVAGLWMALKTDSSAGRLLAAWLAVLAVLAGLRELDLHTMLNPEHLGVLGVRYKVKWWLDPAVPVALRAGWGGLLLMSVLGLLYPPWRLRGSLLEALKHGNVCLLLLGASFCFLAAGFGIDDLMRGSGHVAFENRQFMEETSELIGGILFFLAVMFLDRGRDSILLGGTSSASH